MRYLSVSALWCIAPSLLFLSNQQLAYAQNTEDGYAGLPLSGCPLDNPTAIGAFQACFTTLTRSVPPECGRTATSIGPTCIPYCKSVLVTHGGSCYSSFCPQQATRWVSWANSICDDITATADDTTTSSKSGATSGTGSSATKSTGSSASTSTGSGSTTARTTAASTQTTAGTGAAATTTTGAGTGGAGRIDSAVGIGGAVVGIIGAFAVLL